MIQNSFEKNGGTYTLVEDHLIPDLIIADRKPLGKWGLLRKHFLREHHRALYSSWLLTGKLDEHLTQIEKDCEERFELITMQMAEQENVTEGLKADDQMEWVRRMNSVWNRAEEIVLHELIYV